MQSASAVTAPDARYQYISARESAARTYANSVDRVLERGSLARLYDSHGREYLDCLSCAGTLALGHNHPYVQEQLQRFFASGQIQQGLDLSTPAKHHFMQVFFEQILPPQFAENARIQFCGPTGADSIEAALKLFKTATGRRTILAFHGAYHGMTAGALALTGNLRARHAQSNAFADVHYLPYPYPYRCPFGVGDDGVLALNYIENLLTDPESGIVKPAAIILEAVQGEGGVIPAPPAWLQGLRELTLKLDIPLIIDEVQTGFGRSGAMFAFEHAGIIPDAICISKAAGGGYPLAALLYHERYDNWQSGAHAGTFRGNQIAMVAGAATMEYIVQQNLVQEAQRKGAYLQQKLHGLMQHFPQIGDVRGSGLMWGMEVVDETMAADKKGSHPGDGGLAKAIKQACLEQGLLIETGGRHGAVLRLLPPLIISDAELVELVEKLQLGILTATQQHQREKLANRA